LPVLKPNLFRGKKGHQMRNLLRLAEPANRDLAQCLIRLSYL